MIKSITNWLLQIVRSGHADLVLYKSTDGDEMGFENCIVTVYKSGVVNILTDKEEVTVTALGCEIVWKLPPDIEKVADVKLLRSVKKEDDK